MIKRTFYNLPAEKREKIIEVTRKEFRKGNKQKITINSVIKKAGISRGSFYQYFDDKLDLVELVTDDMLAQIGKFVRDELILNGGNLFEIPMRIFDLSVHGGSQDNLSDILTLTDSRNQNSALISDYMEYRTTIPDVFGSFEKYIDRSAFNTKDDEDIKCVVFMMFDAIKVAVFNVNKNPKDVEKERLLLHKKIKIIKKGITK